MSGTKNRRDSDVGEPLRSVARLGPSGGDADVDTAQPFLHFHPVRASRLAVALAWFVGVTLLLRLPVLGTLGSQYLGGRSGDAGLYVWLFRSATAALDVDSWFTTGAFYPYGRSLAWSDNFILPSLAGKALAAAGLSEVAAYNSLLLASTTANGFFTAWLAYMLTGAAWPSLFAGTLFLAYSGINGHLGHPQLQFAWPLPLSLMFLLRGLAGRPVVHGLAYGILLSASFLTTVYYALFVVALGTWTLLGIIALKGSRVPFGRLARFGAAAAVAVLPLLPFVLPYLEVRDAFHERRLHESAAFAATGVSYFSSSPFNLLYGFTAFRSHDEAHLFPGVTAYLLAGVAVTRLAETRVLGTWAAAAGGLLFATAVASSLPVPGPVVAALAWTLLVGSAAFLRSLAVAEARLGVRYVTNRDLVALLLFVGVAAFVASLGPLGDEASDPPAFGPFVALRWLPGFGAVRATGRFGFVAALMVSLLGAFGLVHLRRLTRHAALLSVLAVPPALLENYHVVIPSEGPEPLPPAYRAMATGAPGPFVSLPFTASLDREKGVASWRDFAVRNVRAMLWGAETGRVTVNGYSGLRSRLMSDYPRWTEGFPDARSVKALKRLGGLRYVVYSPPSGPAGVRDVLSALPPDLRPVDTGDDSHLLLEWDDSRVIASDVVFLPAREGATVTFALRAEPGPSPRTVWATFGEASDPLRRKQLSVPSDGEFHPQKLTIPRPRTVVSPVKLTLEADPGGPVTARGFEVGTG